MTQPMLLIDTNVWLDFFIDLSIRHNAAGALVAEASRRNATLLVSVAAVKDVYYLIGLELKRRERESSGGVSESFARAVDEVAWACISSLRRQSVIVGADAGDIVEALAMRPAHADFEDDVVAAALLRSHADYLVTSDERLLRNQPVPCITIEQAIRVLRGQSPSDTNV